MVLYSGSSHSTPYEELDTTQALISQGDCLETGWTHTGLFHIQGSCHPVQLMEEVFSLVEKEVMEEERKRLVGKKRRRVTGKELTRI